MQGDVTNRPSNKVNCSMVTNFVALEMNSVLEIQLFAGKTLYPTVLKRVIICSVESISRKDPALREILRDYTLDPSSN